LGEAFIYLLTNLQTNKLGILGEAFIYLLTNLQTNKLGILGEAFIYLQTNKQTKCDDESAHAQAPSSNGHLKIVI
jgi:hypothetical protein